MTGTSSSPVSTWDERQIRLTEYVNLTVGYNLVLVDNIARAAGGLLQRQRTGRIRLPSPRPEAATTC